MSIPKFNFESFQERHLSLEPEAMSSILDYIGVDSLEALIDETIPSVIRFDGELQLPSAITEQSVIAELRSIASKNIVRHSLRGRGYYGTFTPPVIRRNVLENPAWYTSYTPYQPEISQGRLEALLNFQTVVSELTGFPIANASLLDEGTACAESMTMAMRLATSKSRRFIVDADTHPQTLEVLKTRAEPIGIELVVGDTSTMDLSDCFGVLLSHPCSSGEVRHADVIRSVSDRVHSVGGIVAIDTDPLFCIIGQSPANLGADIAIGSMQRFGVPMGFGGPHAAFISTIEKFSRSLPGRMVGVSTDTYGRPALRLALQTREQHIRREKATSNICTAQALLANTSAFYAMWHGYEGLSRIANRVYAMTSALARTLQSNGWVIANTRWFDTLTIANCDAASLSRSFKLSNFDVTVISDSAISLSLDETITGEDLNEIARVFGCRITESAVGPLDISDFRHDEILQQNVFKRYRTEHEMLRYLRKLADMDLALDRTMIPLGSCTMKLNATTEMDPITWPEFADMHPFCDEDDSTGYRELINQLESYLIEITGYDAVSLQPNAGSQGEFAGLLAIRAYHRSRGDLQRTICLIPSSAHGTNAASAVMCGMSVTVVNCDSAGNVDLTDLKLKIHECGDKLAALMITYPSTHGVFETEIRKICQMVHNAGGQVYLDGANFNAMVGLAKPGNFGADVSHLNLHKTFCIPHGGGGPGVGPVAVKKHLAEFLPAKTSASNQPVGQVSSAPFGSASILPIAWSYIRLMGPDGLKAATMHAIANANYIAKRLGQHFPILYSGNSGRVAHECILDLRDITKNTGVTVDDVAKRLMDFGFHAPTMSFPVSGTLMVEPTESESKSELDRFCDAMLYISREISEIADEKIAIERSALRNAPHTVADLTSNWDRDYSRETGIAVDSAYKSYFASVNRIDSAYGDRNLVCTCEPIEAYAEISRDAAQTVAQ